MTESANDRPAAFSREWRPEFDQEQGEDILARLVTRHGSRHNWPLWVGGLTTLLVLIIAVAGPTLAARDPMEENVIVQVGDKWEIPPFPPLSVPGFPLGSDQFGRDLLSRLLWGLRPTLLMVSIVAVVRLVLGMAIGLSAGWFTGRLGHGLDVAIGAALSVPVLMVALGAIAVVGIEIGILAFIVGLSINGWGETARLVRDQTQIIKVKLYVEAARALGASDFHILFRHVLRQLMPMAWMLFAFEISSTLMTTAGLGFLGYYIGGEIWIDVSDFVARRLSGTPELGQMLASAWSEQQIITEPWGMIISGSVIFITVLGFNLLGEGLRLRQGLDQVRRRTRVSAVIDGFGSWLERKGVSPALKRAKERATHPVLPGVPLSTASGFILMILVIGGGLFWWRRHAAGQSTIENAPLESTVPGGHLWAAARHDSQGTLWSPVEGPSMPKTHWVFQDSTGFSGGPAVASDGTIYLGSTGGTLYALNPQGSILWKKELPAPPVGAPALGDSGQIHIADQEGGLSTIAPDANLLWRFRPETSGKATTGPIVGPMGNIYYPASGRIYALSSKGELLWTERVPYGFDPLPPQLSPNGELLFFLDAAFHPSDGSAQDLAPVVGTASNEQYVSGADGQTYYRSENRLIQWQLGPSGAEIIHSLNKRIPGIPRDAGVTRDGIVWAIYRGGYNSPDTGIVWLDLNDQVLGSTVVEQMPSQVIAVGLDAKIYSCGNAPDGSAQCAAVMPGSDEAIWQLALEHDGRVVGGALVPGIIYVTLDQGIFYAISDSNPEDQTQALDDPETETIIAEPYAASPRPAVPITAKGEATVETTPAIP